jgi:hypothetical protein
LSGIEVPVVYVFVPGTGENATLVGCEGENGYCGGMFTEGVDYFAFVVADGLEVDAAALSRLDRGNFKGVWGTYF